MIKFFVVVEVYIQGAPKLKRNLAGEYIQGARSQVNLEA